MGQSGRWYLDVSTKVFQGMGTQTQSVFNEFTEGIEGLEEQDMSIIQIAYGLAPDPVTPEGFIERSPYGNPETYKERLEASAQRGWLEDVGEGQYRLTDKGKKVINKLLSLADELYPRLETLPDADLERITALLGRVVKKARELPEPAKKPTLSLVAGFDRGTSIPLVMQMRRRMLDLGAYRDDAHIAAWKPYGVSGHTWEVLTYVWQGNAGTAAELAEQLPYRNYDEKVYAAALEDLAARDWIAEEDGKYVITKKGKKVRQEAEDTTDQYFDAAWAALDEAEMAEAKGLLKKLAEAVQPPEEELAS